MISSHHPDILVLLEPKINGDKADKVCKSLKFEEWIKVECPGYSGGIWLFWKTSVVSIEIINTSPQFIHCEVKEGGLNKWFLTVTYGSPNIAARNLLWDALRNFGYDLRVPWMIIGDFNAVLYSYERSSGNLGYGNKDKAFGDMFDEIGLIDLGFSGPQFTWCRGVSSDTFMGARIERAICNIKWSLMHPHVTIQHIPRSSSDHYPILVDIHGQGNRAADSKRFFFQNAWFTHLDYMS